ncbi:MAG TPA: A/G-specific adenine glycosylase [Acidimicrobiales bacterium]|nr:A/G-specific adenine glycosylase [Acidimicrobiales bacterium]
MSEVMLQQTQVARVVEPWRAFVERFPTPRDCAAAGAPEVVRSWEGLGYNRRALRLHAAATTVVELHGGRIPADFMALRRLPGVGEYTARAVQVFAFEMNVGVVDTNVARVLSRAAGVPLRPADAQALADRLAAPGRSWELNQALFDLGAGHCRSRHPDCAACPIRRLCRWSSAGRPSPDPAGGRAAGRRGQAPFDGSDRQGRGRLVAALRKGPVSAGALATTAGWPEDVDRAERVVGELVAEGFARWQGSSLELG